MRKSADGAHHDVAGIDTDADTHLDTLSAAKFVQVAQHHLLHSQRRIAGAQRMIFVLETNGSPWIEPKAARSATRF
jgi:hypothetical protein